MSKRYMDYEFILKCFESSFEKIEAFYAWYLSRLDYETDKLDLINFYKKHFNENPEKADQLFECMRIAHESFKYTQSLLSDIEP